MEKQGVFYAVSVGPGDPELLTRQACRVLADCPVVAAPRMKSGRMLALDIARRALGAELDGKTILPLHFAMSRDAAVLRASHRAAADAVLPYLDAGQDVAMLNLGDVSIYATFGYLQEILQAQGYLLDVLRLLVPAQPRFDGHGLAHRLHDPARHLDHQRHVAHHARSCAAPGDFLHRAAEVDVYDVGTGRFGHAGRFDHRFDQVAVDLDAHGAFRVVDFEFFERFGRVADQPVRRDELGVDHVGAEAFAHVAERRIGHILHRRQQQGAVS